MTESELQPGDRVIALASCARGAAVLAGAVAAGITVWLTNHILSSTALSAVGGAFWGYLVGFLVSRALFPATQGNVVVIKVGQGSLPQTLKAAVFSAVPASVLVSLLCALVMRTGILNGLWFSLGSGVVIGICWALLASLT